MSVAEVAVGYTVDVPFTVLAVYSTRDEGERMARTIVGDDDEPGVPTVDSVEVGEDGAIRWSTTGPDEDRGEGSSSRQHATGFMGGKRPTVMRRSEDQSAESEDPDEA